MDITVHDVAAKAGVSITTVSLVLNNKPSRISDATKKKVWAAAYELGFRESSSPASPFGTIGVILPDIQNLFFSSICSAIGQAARQNGYTTLVASTEDEAEQDLEYIDVMHKNGVDGIIMIKAASATGDQEGQLAKKLLHTRLPLVSVDRKLCIDNSCAVLVDNQRGAYEAVRHLITMGHRRIGCITGPMHDIVCNERLSGYIEALDEAGLPFDRSLIRTGDYRMESGIKHLPYLLGKAVSAIFCFNDLMAMGVYKGCRNYNHSVPGYLSIIGFDDIPFCESLEVPLSTVHQPTKKIGSAAVEQLLSMLQKKAIPEDILFQPQLKIRASTAPPLHQLARSNPQTGPVENGAV